MFFKFLGFRDQELFQIIIAYMFFSVQFSRRKLFSSIFFLFLDIMKYSRQDQKSSVTSAHALSYRHMTLLSPF